MLMSETVVPVGNRVIIAPDAFEEVTEGGIILPKQSHLSEKESVTTGVVVAVGSSAWDDHGDGEPLVSAGERVVYRRYAGITIEDNGKELKVVNDQDIIVVYRKGDQG